MLRVRTKVTVSPVACLRSSSASAATAATSGPRAENSVTSSSSPVSCPSCTPSITSRTGPRGKPEGGLDVGNELGRRGVPTGGPGGRAPAGQLDLGAVAGVGDVGEPLRQDRARVVAGEPLGVGAVQHREANALVEPPLGVEAVRRPDRQPRREHVPGPLGRLAQPLQRRPRPLRVDVVGGHRRDPAPVVDPGARSAARGRRRGSAAPAPRCRSAGSSAPARSRRDGPTAGTPGGHACRCRAWAGSSGRSPPARGRGARGWSAIACSASIRSARSSPIPTRIPVVYGICSRPAASSVASRRVGCLSGAPR